MNATTTGNLFSSNEMRLKTRTLLRSVVALAAVARLISLGVVVEEVTYVSDHPYAYGPAKVIAWGAGAGAILAVAVGILAFAFMGDTSGDR
jgi:hypothetical protein